ncbi:MAG: hypothetical protein A3D94_10955 [Alphaproteobacteria bacterium RIFCSPHIGHO2_12_FULL_66_14]|jgi:uncharacterized protein YjiS (DUF1127 family)|nr:MAG: hypothetical protein A3D94_10955 [Alphaproteobacteria bacterium RIFCSPHIGHO2_12_FULL_66_14]
MMTQPIQMFESLTSETAPAGRKETVKAGFSLADRQMIELRARYARAELMANALGDALLWLGRQYGRLVAGLKADLKLRAAESQLLRMTDRELADLGLARGDIPFAVREAAEGLAPQIDAVTGNVVAANQNLHRAA